VHSRIVNHEEILKTTSYILGVVNQFRISNKNYLSNLRSLRETLVDDLQRKLFDIVYLHLVNSEKSSPGGSDFFLDFSLNNANEEKNEARLFRKSDLEGLLSSYLDKDLVNLMKEVFSLSNFKTKIILREDLPKDFVSVIEKSQNFYFEGLHSSFKLREKKLRDVRVCPIDGFIESVSEIHYILEKISLLQEPCVLFVRGLSEEVVHTLRVNYEKNTITCIPVVVNFDLEGANLLNDIAVISGCDVVSSFKGEILNSIDIEKSPRIDFATFLPNGISLENKSTDTRVESHVKFLLQKIENTDSSLSEEALTRRLQRLSGGQITLSLSKDHLKRKFQIDKTLRAVQMAKNFGIIEIDEKIFPVSSIAAGRFFSRKFQDTISDLGCVII
jgi:hypothetical protein